MIVVKIELWQFGFEERKKELGRAVIVNDGTGTHQKGNYLIKFYDRNARCFRSTNLENWPRLTNSIWKLMGVVFK